jgi:sporulation protein YlmC with PRC-barrel domain
MRMKCLIATTAIATTVASLALIAPVTNVSAASPVAAMADSSVIDSSKLIKADVRDARGDKIGSIEGVLINRAGKTEAVIVDVGGFLGMGQHRVALDWKDLQVADNGGKVMTQYSKADLKALPEYAYPDQKARNTAFFDPSWYPGPGFVPPDLATRESDRAAAVRWHHVNGDFRVSRLMDATVRTSADENIGTVKDAIVDNSGRVRTIVVDVGGFLGVGSRQVAFDFAELHLSGHRGDLRLTTSLTKDQINSIPPYTGMMAQNSDGASRASGGGKSSAK